MIELNKPKQIEIDGITFIISKWPYEEGREICAQYVTSMTPKVGSYETNRDMMRKLMSYVEVVTPNGTHIRLTTPALINNHINSEYSVETGMALEKAMMVYNCSFLQLEKISGFFGNIAQNIPAWITKILTDSLRQLSTAEKPPSTN